MGPWSLDRPPPISTEKALCYLSGIVVIQKSVCETDPRISAKIYWNQHPDMHAKLQETTPALVNRRDPILLHILQEWLCRNSHTRNTKFYYILYIFQIIQQLIIIY